MMSIPPDAGWPFRGSVEQPYRVGVDHGSLRAAGVWFF
jgi:hypothetical protein